MFALSFQATSNSAIALFLPMIRQELGLNFTAGGILSAASMFIYTLMQVPSGYLSDRFGARKVFLIGLFGTTILCFLLGLINAYWQAIANQAASGIFRALLFAPGIALLAGWFASERRATAMGLSLAGMMSGQVVLNGVGPIIESFYNWRIPFLVFASVGIMTSITYLFWGKGAPDMMRRSKIDLRYALMLFRHKAMWICGGIQYVRLALHQGITFWLPSLLIEEKGLALQVTGLIIALRSLVIIPSNILGAYISDRLQKPALLINISLLMLAVTTALIVRVEDTALVILLVIVNSIFVQLYFGPLFAIPVDIFGKEMTGTLTGFGNFIGNIGSFTIISLLGLLKDLSGTFKSGFYTLTGLCLVGIIFTLMLEQNRKASIAKPKVE